MACCRGAAVQAVRVQLPSGSSSLVFAIDATRTGNIGRFINHRCVWGVAALPTGRLARARQQPLWTASAQAAGDALVTSAPAAMPV